MGYDASSDKYVDRWHRVIDPTKVTRIALECGERGGLVAHY